MSLNILGLSGALTHDPSAAIYVDGKLIAAAEEERFIRDKHAKDKMPYEAAKFCLKYAGLRPADIDVVAVFCFWLLVVHMALPDGWYG